MGMKKKEINYNINIFFFYINFLWVFLGVVFCNGIHSYIFKVTD